MRRWRGLVAVVAVGCSPTPLTLGIAIDVGPGSTCGVMSCEDVTLACDPYVSILIIDPDDPKSPYQRICQPLDLDQNQDLCSVSNVQLLSNVTVPAQSLEVQVVIYPKSQLPFIDGVPKCPTDIEFNAVNGLPVEGVIPPVDQPPGLPAIGGRAFYHPGDALTVVRLGCTDLTLVDGQRCDGAITPVQATVVDFNNPTVSVSAQTAANLDLAVGEPLANQGSFTFDAANSFSLERVADVDPPEWKADVHNAFTSTACVQIIDEQTGETTPTLTCQPTMPKNPLDITATRLTKSSLDQILTAIGKSSFPDQGLVVGLVLDATGQPKSGVTVVPTDGSTHVEYINATRTGVVTGMTSASGIFVSQDAPYTTSFGATDGTTMVPAAPGGLVVGKVTIVILELD